MQKNRRMLITVLLLALSSQLSSMETETHPKYGIDKNLPMETQLKMANKYAGFVPRYVDTMLTKAVTIYNVFLDHRRKNHSIEMSTKLQEDYLRNLLITQAAIGYLEEEQKQLRGIRRAAERVCCITETITVGDDTLHTEIPYATDYKWKNILENVSEFYRQGVPEMQLVLALLNRINTDGYDFYPKCPSNLPLRIRHWETFPIKKEFDQRLKIAALLESNEHLEEARHFLGRTRRALKKALDKLRKDHNFAREENDQKMLKIKVDLYCDLTTETTNKIVRLIKKIKKKSRKS